MYFDDSLHVPLGIHQSERDKIIILHHIALWQLIPLIEQTLI